MDAGRLPAAPENRAPPAARDRSIGALLVDSGRLTAAQAESVLRHARAAGVRFGDAAVALGFATTTDVQHALALQFDYPYLAPQDDAVGKEVVAAFTPFAPAVEALRALRTQLVLRWFDAESPRKSLALVSAGRGEGRSYLAANLAVVFSQLGERTLLVDADLRHPRQHRIFNLDGGAGLSALLAGRGDDGAVRRIRGLVDLSVLPAGAVPPNPQELLGRPAFAALHGELGRRYDVILLDTSAAALGADFQAVSSVTGGALLVARRNATRAADAAAVNERVVNAGARAVGVVLNEH